MKKRDETSAFEKAAARQTSSSFASDFWQFLKTGTKMVVDADCRRVSSRWIAYPALKHRSCTIYLYAVLNPVKHLAETLTSLFVTDDCHVSKR